MAQIETLVDAQSALERCGDLFRAEPVRCNMVAAAVSPAFDFEVHRIFDDANTLGAVLLSPHGVTLTPIAPGAVELAAGAVPIGRASAILGPAGEAAQIAGSWSERSGGSITHAQIFRLYRVGTLADPSSRRDGTAVVTGHDRIEQAAHWAVGFGAETGLIRTIDDSRDQMARAVNDGRLLEWRVRGEVVSQLVVSAVRFGVVRIGGVYTPPERRGHGYAAALTAAVSAMQMDRQNVDDVTLNTQASNPATNRLYRRLGFESVSEMLHAHLEPAQR